MLRFTDPNRVISVPKSYTLKKPGNSLRVVWPDTIHFGTFYTLVTEAAVANGYETPSAEVVMNDICLRLPKGACTSDGTPYRPPTIPARSGCRSCGRR